MAAEGAAAKPSQTQQVMSGNLDAITALVRAHTRGNILVVTGAGISLASGIPTWDADVACKKPGMSAHVAGRSRPF